jgi:NAD(P)H-dependent flavin oxidoreductase YrpB (nitropropane dioxygenase family)
MEFTSIKNQRLFEKWKNHKTIISNLPNECNYKTFNIKYPIIQAGMIWVSGHKLASAVSNAGGLGLIGGSMYPEVLREHIQKCKKKLLSL